MDEGEYYLSKKEEVVLKCTGCGICKDICGNQAIFFEEDTYGFWYPHIDNSKCTKCGLCEKLCPIYQDKRRDVQNQRVYAAQSRDNKILAEASSGGIFSELANIFLESGGMVIGAEMGLENRVKHVIIDRKEDLYRVQKSKYVESYFGDVLSQLKKQSGKKILVCGTPCQIYAIRSALGNVEENILYCDIVCHGVNSPKVFQRYIREKEEEYGARAVKVNFRDKSYGWEEYALYISFDNGKEYRVSNKEDVFLRGFIKNFYLRASCADCDYRGRNRVGDITLGDFWGIKEAGHFERSQGISLVIINNLKAQKYFDQIKENIYYEERTWEEACEKNKCIVEKNIYNRGIGHFREKYNSASNITLLIQESLDFERRERDGSTGR